MNIDPDNYFANYEDLEIHELMLRDRPRQKAFYNAIQQNAELIRGKVVLDVGAGTGILSAFCGKVGAKRVYAVEASNLAKIAAEIIEENDLAHVVKVKQSRIEDFKLPVGAEKVDIIISEWMGFYLLHEGMLDSVLFARDNFLKSGGMMFPNEATIYVAPCEVPNRYDYWDNVDGIKMTKFGAKLREQKATKPEIMTVNTSNLLHEGIPIHWMHLEEVTVDELEHIKFQDTVVAQKEGKHQGFCIWFECRFPNEQYEDAEVLSTSPKAPPTHWQQCVAVLPENVCDDVAPKSPIAFEIELKRHEKDPRKYNIVVEILDPTNTEHPIPCECIMTKCIVANAHLKSMDLNTETNPS